MTIMIDLPPDAADRLARRAAQDGQDLAGYVRRLAMDAAKNSAIPERNERLIALLDSFEAGDAEAQFQDLNALRQNLADDRPGQRDPFGEDSAS